MVSNLPKGVHEALCAATSALGQVGDSLAAAHIEQINVLIRDVEMHRPLGHGGKHGDLHTATCGCEGHRAPWSLVLIPGDAP